ncbi:MAG: hypothetical protein ACJA0Z_004395 [Halioglobus sp.]|jgi:hypothetical protein
MTIGQLAYLYFKSQQRFGLNLATVLVLTCGYRKSQKLPFDGTSTALFDSFTCNFSRWVMNRIAVAMTRSPER